MVRKNTSFFFHIVNSASFWRPFPLDFFNYFYDPFSLRNIHFDSILYFIYILVFIFKRGEKVIKKILNERESGWLINFYKQKKSDLMLMCFS